MTTQFCRIPLVLSIAANAMSRRATDIVTQWFETVRFKTKRVIRPTNANIPCISNCFGQEFFKIFFYFSTTIKKRKMQGMWIYIIPALALLAIMFSFFYFEKSIAVSVTKSGGKADSTDESLAFDGVQSAGGGVDDTVRTKTKTLNRGTYAQCENSFKTLRKVDDCSALSLSECGNSENPKAYEMSSADGSHRKCTIFEESFDTDERGTVEIEKLESSPTLTGGESRPVEVEGSVEKVRMSETTKTSKCGASNVGVNCNFFR